ncbi:MAG: hypothetical protein JWO37_2458 [Acidimicrobiales bacterium]|jgi:MFS family permease|nr:hypothetical protein [Acidimicrobiales bacterium]
MLHAVAHVVTRTPSTPEASAVADAPRTGFVDERRTGPGRFEAERGPMNRYQRTVSVEDGEIVEHIDFSLAVPYFSFLFTPLVWWWFKHPGPPGRQPWWAPPEQFDARAASALGTLAAIAVVFGYLNSLFTQTVAFAGDEFHAGNSAQGIAGGVVRVGGLLALVLVSVADRKGRRVVLIGTLVAGCVLAVTGAFAPSLAWLTASQILARGFATALLVVGFIVAAEELPAGSRAYGTSLLALAAALGTGICVLFLRLADVDPRAWRLLYVIPLLALPIARDIARRLPESRRFVAPHAERPSMGAHARRLWLIAGTMFLANLFVAPSSQFTNRFLKHERHYSGGAIGLLTLGTGTPGVIGVVVGGRWADTRGRRRIGAFSLVVGTALSVVFFFMSGSGLWLIGVASSIVGGLAVPALAVYGPELFPTALRGRANGIITIVSLAGSVVGLVAVGAMADGFGSIGPAMTVVAIGPMLYALIVIRRFPETAGLELEQINPEDRIE